MSFKALLATRENTALSTRLVDFDERELLPGEVTVAVDFSTINYKDALAVTGQAPIIQHFPLIPGIDFAGTVEHSTHPDFQVGERIVANGWGLGQTHHGGFAQKARVPGDWLIKLPTVFSTREAMAIGTAGYTAMLAVLALEHAGLTPAQGDVLVTGASGGAGSIAIALLAQLGYRVVASTGRLQERDYLHGLGATELIDRQTLAAPGKPLAGERWAAAIDSVGSHTLANVLAQTRYGGAVAAFGLAQGADLPGSVLPFILRGVTLAGIDSVQAPRALRQLAWERLARDLDLAKLATTTTCVGLADVKTLAPQVLAGQVRGRTLVDVNA